MIKIIDKIGLLPVLLKCCPAKVRRFDLPEFKPPGVNFSNQFSESFQHHNNLDQQSGDSAEMKDISKDIKSRVSVKVS